VKCADGTIGFYRSFTSDARGEPTPEHAVAHEERTRPAQLNPPPEWQVTHAADEATFTAADVSLHVIRLPSGGWIVDSGQYCR
jgi:hypothetical protein